MTQLSPAFVETLRAEREKLNGKFAHRLRGGHRIDADAFLQHLEQRVAPLVEQVEVVMPERTRGALLALYDASLDLFAASLLGPDAKMPWVQLVWSNVLPAVAAEVLARQPQQVAGCLCNASFQIASQRGTRPEQFVARMQQVAPQCVSLTELLEAGKIAAWQVGMVQFRAAALEAAGALRPSLAGLALGIVEATSADELATLLGRLRENVWMTVEAACGGGSRAAIICTATAGAFTGFGGDFIRPPLVRFDGQRLLASDGRWQWELLADAYGVWLRRIGSAPVKHPKTANEPGIAIDARGIIRWGMLTLAQPHLAHASSFACSGQTLAITIPTSHHVFLYSSTGLSA